MRNLSVVSLAVLLAACSKPSAEIPVVTEPARAEIARANETPSACELVTANEMSMIVGFDVTATSDDVSSRGVTKCGYAPTSGKPMPIIELKVEWGMAEAAMVAGGMLGRMEQGELTDPLAGVGDQAYMVGSEAMIRHGEDLVRIMAYGVDEPLTAIREIFATAEQRLQ